MLLLFLCTQCVYTFTFYCTIKDRSLGLFLPGSVASPLLLFPPLRSPFVCPPPSSAHRRDPTPPLSPAGVKKSLPSPSSSVGGPMYWLRRPPLFPPLCSVPKLYCLAHVDNSQERREGRRGNSRLRKGSGGSKRTGEGVSVRFWCHGVLLRHITSSPGEKRGGPARKQQKVGKKEAGGQKTDIFTVEDKKSPPLASSTTARRYGKHSPPIGSCFSFFCSIPSHANMFRLARRGDKTYCFLCQQTVGSVCVEADPHRSVHIPSSFGWGERRRERKRRMGEAPIVNRNTYMCRYGIRKSYVDAGTRTHGTNARTHVQNTRSPIHLTLASLI